ncbi:hypothetical protein ACIBCT_21190 [Streptosporangium sp. NPDC050855]|uniref:hypothetical protein n=1 Tax=Streptosporangium sp. NPDC050855 TaxID=3366194 RepID=UPI0037B459D2
MSETATEPEVTEEPTGIEPDPSESMEPPADSESRDEPDKAKDWEAEVSKWRAMARKHEQTAKANAEAARKYAEFEESQKSEQQRIADRLAAAEQRAVAAEIGRAKLMAAAAYNIPTSLLDRLGGSNEDEINEAAQELSRELEAELERRLAAMPPPAASEKDEEEHSYPVRTRPVESLTPGALPADYAPEDVNEAFRRFLGR